MSVFARSKSIAQALRKALAEQNVELTEATHLPSPSKSRKWRKTVLSAVGVERFACEQQCMAAAPKPKRSISTSSVTSPDRIRVERSETEKKAEGVIVAPRLSRAHLPPRPRQRRRPLLLSGYVAQRFNAVAVFAPIGRDEIFVATDAAAARVFGFRVM